MLQRIRIISIDKKFLIGIAVGILISALSTIIFNTRTLSDADIEKRAMALGMKYPSEMKVVE
ncbi:hypothetical protein [Metaclostridioides mangenotii]|uniref:hypothetical protein n=1 Tax=Metaclostridioides mangenotii TaxID=1540 RepID=UPI0004677798|nr:hypothetical protein [Clostridioides mangenotii]